MVITIYHGSDHIIEHPVFHGGKRNNDYGYGFYCTESQDMAKEWAVTREKDGYANAYHLETKDFTILELNRQYPLICWISMLLQNRRFNLDSPLAQEAYQYITKTFFIDPEGYDLVIGYRADDSYFSYAQDFLNNTISYEQLSAAMKLGNLGEQIVLKSRRSFERIRFLQAVPALRSQWFPRKELRDRAARNIYFSPDRMRYHRGELYVTEMLDKEMKADDARLR